MSQPKVCPECGSRDTTRQFFDQEADRVIEVRICNNCPTQYEVRYGDPIKEATRVEGPNGEIMSPEEREAKEADDGE